MKKTLIACIVALAGTAGAAAAQDLYTHVPGNCDLGEEGVLEVGSGTFAGFESRYDRVGAKTDIGNGYFQADYDISFEGEIAGRETVRMRVSDQDVHVIYQDGQEYQGNRCR